MFLAALLRAGAEQGPVKIRNMSFNGAMLDCSIAPSPGTEVLLIRGGLVARGTVVWTDARRCGVRFASAVSVTDWLASPAKVEQQRVDDVVAMVKAGALPVAARAAMPAAAAPARSAAQAADDLGSVLRLMQDLEDDLAASDETLSRHGLKLQNLDIAMQMVRAIAQGLQPDQRCSPSGARLEDLRVVCEHALRQN